MKNQSSQYINPVIFALSFAADYITIITIIQNTSWHHINPYPANIFVLKMLSAFTSAAYTQVLFRLDFILEANTMNTDQTAPHGSSLTWVHIVCNNSYLRT